MTAITSSNFKNGKDSLNFRHQPPPLHFITTKIVTEQPAAGLEEGLELTGVAVP